MFCLFIIVGLCLPLIGVGSWGVLTAEASNTQPINNLPIGAKLADPSWLWEFRTGWGYTYESGDVKKPVTWIVVAKDHYGAESGVTLMTEELIGSYVFDNNSKIFAKSGSNHWGDSGTHHSATKGLRPWLNSTGIHAGEGFYNAFSDSFKSSIITTSVPNVVGSTGNTYTTADKVFIPSYTELGITVDNYTYPIGEAYQHFVGSTSIDRKALINGTYHNNPPGP